MEDFKDLQVWQKAHELTLAVYHVSRRFPKEELYGLTAQMRRAAASMGANVAEGARPQVGWGIEAIPPDRSGIGK